MRTETDRAERAFMQALTAERHRSTFGHCVYCGQHSYGRTCVAHRDLLELDSNFREARLRPCQS